MRRFVYTVWLRDQRAPDDDPDKEWPACFIIVGTSLTTAKAWGDHLAERYAANNEQTFLGSAAEAVDESSLGELDTLPVIDEGEDASEEKIGW